MKHKEIALLHLWIMTPRHPYIGSQWHFLCCCYCRFLPLFAVFFNRVFLRPVWFLASYFLRVSFERRRGCGYPSFPCVVRPVRTCVRASVSSDNRIGDSNTETKPCAHGSVFRFFALR